MPKCDYCQKLYSPFDMEFVKMVIYEKTTDHFDLSVMHGMKPTAELVFCKPCSEMRMWQIGHTIYKDMSTDGKTDLEREMENKMNIEKWETR